MSHTCPANGCNATVISTVLMCRADWKRVPADLQREVYAAWNRGKGAGTERHIKAMMAAVEAVNRAPAQPANQRGHELPSQPAAEVTAWAQHMTGRPTLRDQSTEGETDAER